MNMVLCLKYLPAQLYSIYTIQFSGLEINNSIRGHRLQLNIIVQVYRL